jgi:hypothetical protein
MKAMEANFKPIEIQTKIHPTKLQKFSWGACKKKFGDDTWMCDGFNFNNCLDKEGTLIITEPSTVVYHCEECENIFCKMCFDKYGDIDIHGLKETTVEALEEREITVTCSARNFTGCASGK